jgi:hypothetical protein
VFIREGSTEQQADTLANVSAVGKTEMALLLDRIVNRTWKMPTRYF